MIKKMICISLVVLFLCMFTGCMETSVIETEHEETPSMFQMVECTNVYGYICKVMYHKDTKVMYVLDYYNHFTLMVDAEGKPLLWEE